MKCIACDSEIEALSAQLRSADEGRQLVYTCPKCPLQINKFANTNKAPHIYMPKIENKKSITPHIQTKKYSHIHVVYIHIKALNDISKFKKVKCFNIIGERNNVFKYHMSGPFKNKAIRQESQRKVGPYASLISYKYALSDISIDETYTAIQYMKYMNSVYIIDGQNYYITMKIPDTSIGSISEALEEMYIYGHGPTTLKGLITPAILGNLSNLTARAYDQSEIDTEDCEASTKPDGDRIWLTRIGLVWLQSKRLIGHEVISWNIDSTIEDKYLDTIGPCIDLELMHSGLSNNIFNSSKTGSPKLIDVLMDEKEVISSQQRTRKWIYDEFKRIAKLFSYLQICHMRKFRNTVREALEDCKTCGYPTDGVVAIRKNGTDMFKIKSIKSIELKVAENGILETEDNTQLFQLVPQSLYPQNSLVEIKFSVDNKQLIIDSHFLRTDKLIANKSDVIHSIVLSTTPKESRGILRTQLWRWSNMVRSNLYIRAARICQDKQIIIDVGSGDGQSVESFIPGKSYIIIEKNEQSCKGIARRLKVRQDEIHKEPRSIIPSIARMKRGTTRYHIINSTLQHFLDDKVVRNNIEGLIGCCIGSMSAQYVIECLSILYSLRIPFIGTCYTYDGINVGDSIINSSGLSMTRTTNDTARVTWGKDVSYIEPVLTSDNMPPNIAIIPAISDVPYITSDIDNPGYIASQHVKVLIYT